MYQLSATLKLPKFQYNLPNFLILSYLILNVHVDLALSGSISGVSHLRNLSPFIFYFYPFIYFRKNLYYRNV